MSRSPKRILVVVHRDQHELYLRMRERYGDTAFVTLDERHADRRRRNVPVEVDRRRASRRRPWTTAETNRWTLLGYRLIYRTEVSGQA